MRACSSSPRPRRLLRGVSVFAVGGGGRAVGVGGLKVATLAIVPIVLLAPGPRRDPSAAAARRGRRRPVCRHLRRRNPALDGRPTRRAPGWFGEAHHLNRVMRCAVTAISLTAGRQALTSDVTRTDGVSDRSQHWSMSTIRGCRVDRGPAAPVEPLRVLMPGPASSRPTTWSASTGRRDSLGPRRREHSCEFPLT